MSKDIGFCSITEDLCKKDGKCEDCSLKHIHENIEHYAKRHEAGRLIELPCAVGDTVYVFGKFHHGIEEKKVKELRITEDCIRVMADSWDGEICEVHQIGKTVKSDYETNGYYLSITEAAEAKQAWEEAKLKELEE